MDVDITYSGVRPGEKLYEEVFFGHEAVEPTAHPKVLRSPADSVSDAKAELIETLIQSALNEPDNWVGLRVQLRALVPDFHVPPRRRCQPKTPSTVRPRSPPSES